MYAHLRTETPLTANVHKTIVIGLFHFVSAAKPVFKIFHIKGNPDDFY